MYSTPKSDNSGLFGSPELETKNWMLGVGEHFGVTDNGELYCTNGHFSGVIDAKAGGKIAGWEITDDSLIGPKGWLLSTSGDSTKDLQTTIIEQKNRVWKYKYGSDSTCDIISSNNWNQTAEVTTKLYLAAEYAYFLEKMLMENTVSFMVKITYQVGGVNTTKNVVFPYGSSWQHLTINGVDSFCL
jgi:hypothetical protein